jgi:superfamily II DNA helicase RecQ
MSEEKKQILDRWTQASNTPHIVATTSLAEGFDYPHVRLVMNVDEPESLVIFAQEPGRAGRDGKRACSLVLLPATWEPLRDAVFRDAILRYSETQKVVFAGRRALLVQQIYSQISNLLHK